jgi:hypothetical protein
MIVLTILADLICSRATLLWDIYNIIVAAMNDSFDDTIKTTIRSRPRWCYIHCVHICHNRVALLHIKSASIVKNMTSLPLFLLMDLDNERCFSLSGYVRNWALAVWKTTLMQQHIRLLVQFDNIWRLNTYLLSIIGMTLRNPPLFHCLSHFHGHRLIPFQLMKAQVLT